MFWETNMRKILDRLVEMVYKWTVQYRNKRRLEELRKRDPFIYN